MDDTVRPMRRCAPASIVALVAACGADPSLRVEVEHPDGFTVADTVVSVYESDLFSCTGVEFGDFSAAELQAALVDEDHIDAVTGDGDGLSGISRTKTKVIVARGYDSAGVFVTAGCVEKGLVEGAETVTIVTVPTATVSVGGAGQDAADPFGMIVTVTDPLVRSLASRRVAWRVFGAVGAEPYAATNMTVGTAEWTPASPPCTNDNGVLKIHPMPPADIGGFATQLRVSWSNEPPRLFSAFTKADVTPTNLSPLSATLHWCAPRLAGTTHRLVCVEDPGAGAVARDFAVSVVDGGARLAEMQTHQFATDGLGANEKVIAVYSVDRGTARDVYAVTNRARVVGLFNPSVPATGGPRVIEVDDALLAPACGTLPPQLMLHELLTSKIRAMDATGATAPQPFFDFATTDPVTFNQTGCVTELAPGGVPKLRQVVALDIGRSQTAAVFACDAAGGICQVRMPVPRAGVGFLPGAEPRLLAASLDASGVVLSSFVLQPDKDRLDRLVERDRTAAAAFPQHLVVGNFDGDSEPDLFWNITNLVNTAASLQISYAREVAGARLSALSQIIDDLVVIDTVVADVTGDGHDDVIMTVQNSPVAPTSRGVVVIPTGVASPSFTPMLDNPCQ